MIIISHRGNLLGKKTNKENTPNYIDEALNYGLNVEVDIRFIKNHFYLGHDFPKTKISYSWLKKRSQNLLIHCKNHHALFNLKQFHTFFHQGDDFVYTSKNYIWQHNLRFKVNSRSIIPVFEKNKFIEWLSKKNNLPFGICTDWPLINDYK